LSTAPYKNNIIYLVSNIVYMTVTITTVHITL
jgi:hypothetical protein